MTGRKFQFLSKVRFFPHGTSSGINCLHSSFTRSGMGSGRKVESGQGEFFLVKIISGRDNK